MSNMKYLITGVSGLVGSHLTRHLVDNTEHSVVGLHRSRNPESPLYRMGYGDHITVEHADVTDYEAVRAIIAYHQPDVVVHLAAVARVGQCRSDPVAAHRVNAVGTTNVFDAVRTTDTDATVVHASTDKIYGEQMNAAVGDKMHTTGPYTASKIAADHIAQSYMAEYDMDVRIYRACNVFGYEPQGGRIVSNTIMDCLNGDDPVVFAGIEGLREYIYVDDLARAIIALVEENDPWVYNVATGTTISQPGVVSQILDHFEGLEPRHVEPDDTNEAIQAQSMAVRDQRLGTGAQLSQRDRAND